MSGVATQGGSIDRSLLDRAPIVIGALAFLWLFREPALTLGRDWLNDPEAGHGLLLGPVAVYLAWKKGVRPDPRPQVWLGVTLLTGAVLLRIASALAAELFTMRMSMLGAAAGLIVFIWGFGQLRRWWLPATLLVLSVPLPSVVLSTLAFPLQLKASEMGASLLVARDVPTLLDGNVIHLPGQSLFVTEACAGLRSLTALISLGVLMGGLWLGTALTRIALLIVTIPVAMVVNGVRIFLTGFLVFFVDPELGEGFMHYTEGWVLFIVAFAVLGSFTWLMARGERSLAALRRRTAEATP